MFRFISFKGEFLWALEIRRICMRRSRFALQSRSSGFPYKSLYFCKFSSCHKIFVFRCKGLEISIFPNIVPLFLSPIIICQQLLLVVIDSRKGFWRAKLPRFLTKPSNFCNIQIVIKSQPYTALVWKLVSWLFRACSLQLWNSFSCS